MAGSILTNDLAFQVETLAVQLHTNYVAHCVAKGHIYSGKSYRELSKADRLHWRKDAIKHIRECAEYSPAELGMIEGTD